MTFTLPLDPSAAAVPRDQVDLDPVTVSTA